MNRSLPFLISLLLWLPANAVGQVTDDIVVQENDRVRADAPVNLDNRYYFELNRDGNSLSGLLITRQENGEILGSIINEFGVSAIDFVYQCKQRHFELKHVAKFLDKWYIRRTLKKDLAYCLDCLYNLNPKPSNTYIIVTNPDSTCILNRKLNIAYTFSPLISSPDNGT